MKLEMPKPKNQTFKQLALWNAIDSSPHNTAEIARHSGYHRNHIVMWLKGQHDPITVNFDNVMQAIKELSLVKPTHRTNWDDRVTLLAECRAEGMSYSQIAKKIKGAKSSIRAACIRHDMAA